MDSQNHESAKFAVGECITLQEGNRQEREGKADGAGWGPKKGARGGDEGEGIGGFRASSSLHLFGEVRLDPKESPPVVAGLYELEIMQDRQRLMKAVQKRPESRLEEDIEAIEQMMQAVRKQERGLERGDGG